MQAAGLNIQRTHIPYVESSGSGRNAADPDISSIARNRRVIDQETLWELDLPFGSPLPAYLPGLSVVPAASEFLVVNDHKWMHAERIAAGGNHHAVIVKRQRVVAA